MSGLPDRANTVAATQLVLDLQSDFAHCVLLYNTNELHLVREMLHIKLIGLPFHFQSSCSPLKMIPAMILL